jgi:hypothetical protein
LKPSHHDWNSTLSDLVYNGTSTPLNNTAKNAISVAEQIIQRIARLDAYLSDTSADDELQNFGDSSNIEQDLKHYLKDLKSAIGQINSVGNTSDEKIAMQQNVAKQIENELNQLQKDNKDMDSKEDNSGVSSS